MKIKNILLVTILFWANLALAQTDIWVRGSGKLFPIALPQLCLAGAGGDAQREIPQVVGRDLDLSGYFEVINPGSYIEAPGKCGGPESFAFSDWSVIGAEGLVKGTVEAVGSEVRVKLYLYDVSQQKLAFGKEYQGDSSQIRMIAHRFANEIMKFFTGESGVFGSQIAFVSRVGRFKEIFVMDMDGGNLRQLTNDLGLAISPSWDARGQKLTFTSYRNRVPDLFEMDVNSKRSRQITRGPALEIGGHYTADGNSVILSLSEGRDSSIQLLGLDGSARRTIVKGNGVINVSPSFSPDNSKIVFCSNRGGGPQIYTMTADGADITRISFANSSYCTSPAWSPKGDRIAYICRADAGHQIFVSNPDGSNAEQLTSVGSNEDPEWSPDGRYIAFSSTFGRGPTYNLAVMRSDGSSVRQLTKSRGGDFEPAWGPVP